MSCQSAPMTQTVLTLLLRFDDPCGRAEHALPYPGSAHLCLGIETEPANLMRPNPVTSLADPAGDGGLPPAFPTEIRFCPTCRTETPHQYRGFGDGAGVRICACCLDRALRASGFGHSGDV
jgi:hypothetical protein